MTRSMISEISAFFFMSLACSQQQMKSQAELQANTGSSCGPPNVVHKKCDCSDYCCRGQKASLYGLMSNEAGAPLDGVALTIQRQNYNGVEVIYRENIASKGCYCTGVEMPTGDYIIKFSHSAYQTITLAEKELSHDSAQRVDVIFSAKKQ